MDFFAAALRRLCNLFILSIIFCSFNNSVLAQSKKEQIASLTYERDSLAAVLRECQQNGRQLQESLDKVNSNFGDAKLQISEFEREAGEVLLLIQSINGTLTASHKRFLSTQALAKFYVDLIAATQLGYQDLQGRESGATEEN